LHSDPKRTDSDRAPLGSHLGKFLQCSSVYQHDASVAVFHHLFGFPFHNNLIHTLTCGTDQLAKRFLW
jgi:hypothetical protein